MIPRPGWVPPAGGTGSLLGIRDTHRDPGPVQGVGDQMAAPAHTQGVG